MVLNKVDLLPYVPFEVAAAEENARKVHPGMEIVRVSCTSSEGIDGWLAWIERRRRAARAAAGERLVAEPGR
jgi:hydrogenase nickel incorporation protein HypB